MRTFVPGRQRLAALIFAVLTLLPVASGADQVFAGEDLRACLMREADQFFRRLAVAITASEVDPASVDDAYIARETKPIVDKCTKANGQPDADADAAFQAHLARWSYHLDRKLSEIIARGASD